MLQVQQETVRMGYNGNRRDAEESNVGLVGSSGTQSHCSTHFILFLFLQVQCIRQRPMQALEQAAGVSAIIQAALMVLPACIAYFGLVIKSNNQPKVSIQAASQAYPSSRITFLHPLLAWLPHPSPTHHPSKLPHRFQHPRPSYPG